jgi:hypothetical protein
MNNMRFFKKVVLSFDFMFAIVIGVILWLILPVYIQANFVMDITSVSINILSIIFSLFFAALAIVISTSEDSFALFLEDEGIYTELVNTFKFSLYAIFLALLYAVLLYATTRYFSVMSESAKLLTSSYDFTLQNKAAFIVFITIFIYALFACLYTVNDTITYSLKRISYLKKK